MLPLDCCCEISAGLVICNLPAPRLQPGPATTQRPYWRGPASSQPITARAAGHVMLAAGTVRSLAALLHSQGQLANGGRCRGPGTHLSSEGFPSVAAWFFPWLQPVNSKINSPNPNGIKYYIVEQ